MAKEMSGQGCGCRGLDLHLKKAQLGSRLGTNVVVCPAGTGASSSKEPDGGGTREQEASDELEQLRTPQPQRGWIDVPIEDLLNTASPMVMAAGALYAPQTPPSNTLQTPPASALHPASPFQPLEAAAAWGYKHRSPPPDAMAPSGAPRALHAEGAGGVD
ncbi:hypothetical protein T484DRAFT_1809303, partial [Baffinella frigidus]